MIVIILGKLVTSRMTHGFEKINLLPLKRLFIKNRMKKLIENVFKRQDYLMKWEGFQNIKRMALVS